MEAADLRSFVKHVQDQICVEATSEGVVVRFASPDEATLAAAGFKVEGVRRLLDSPWWDEMVGDILDTPAFAEPGDGPEQILAYARDVVFEYVAKRFTP